jgi:hypothetical protein
MRTSKLLTTLAVISVVFIAGCNKDDFWNNGPALVNPDGIPVQVVALGTVPLGSASTFAVLAGTTVTNAEASVITGDLGVSPGTEATGFQPEPLNRIEGPGTVTAGLGLVSGTIYAGGAVAALAHNDATIAYQYLVDQTPTTTYLDVVNELGGLTLTPGIYKYPSSANLGTNEILYLDFKGDPNALFIFQIGSTLVTKSNSQIVALNNPDATCLGVNVYWAVGSSATVDGDSFIGTVIAYTTITMTNTGNASGATNVSGRMLALGGAVTMVNSIISTCGTSGGGTEPPKPCRDFVTGGGWIKVNSDGHGHKYNKNDKATFGVSGGILHGKFWGQLSFNDHNGVQVKSTRVTAYLVIDSVTRQIEGIARVGRTSVTYTVVVKDLGEPGRYDTFSLVLSDGYDYSISGTLGGGNIQLHKECGESHIKHDKQNNCDKEDYYDRDELHGNNCDNDHNWDNDHDWNNDHGRR